MPRTHNNRLSAATITSACLALVAGCGGSDSPSPPPAPAPATLTISGTVASGSALAGATVDARCATGNASATAGADGSYTLTVSGGALPCALRATSAAATLYSVAAGNGSSAAANITTLTHLVVADASGQAPAAWYDAFAGASAPTAAAVDAAIADVKSVLAAAGVDATAVANPFTSALTAKNGGTNGDAHDQMLDALSARLAAAGTTLAEVAAAVAARSPLAPAPDPNAATPAPEMLLAAADASCAGLRSGTYRIVIPGEEGGITTATMRVDTQARTLSFFVNGQPDDTRAYSADGGCAFTGTDNDSYAVSAAGVIIGKLDGGTVPFIAFPERAATLADLAGTWNDLGVSKDEGQLLRATATLDGSGALVSGTACRVDLGGSTSCVSITDKPVITVNSAGGFDLTFANGDVDRAFLYRSGTGARMLVSVWKGGNGLEIMTPAQPRALPVVGAVRNSFELSFDTRLTGGSITSFTQTIVSVDTAAKSWVRRRPNGSATFDETLTGDDPVAGYTHRAAQTVTDSLGATFNVRELLALGITGMDLSVVALPGTSPTTNLYGFSLTKH